MKAIGERITPVSPSCRAIPRMPDRGGRTTVVDAPLRAAGPGVTYTPAAPARPIAARRRANSKTRLVLLGRRGPGLVERRDVPDGAPRTRGRLVTERS